MSSEKDKGECSVASHGSSDGDVAPQNRIGFTVFERDLGAIQNAIFAVNQLLGVELTVDWDAIEPRGDLMKEDRMVWISFVPVAEPLKINYLEDLPDPSSDFSKFSEEERLEFEAKITLHSIQWNRSLRESGLPGGQVPVPFRFPPDGRLPQLCFPESVGRNEMIDQILECVATGDQQATSPQVATGA